MVLTSPRARANAQVDSAGFQTCWLADFQIGRRAKSNASGFGTRDTADFPAFAFSYGAVTSKRSGDGDLRYIRMQEDDKTF